MLDCILKLKKHKRSKKLIARANPKKGHPWKKSGTISPSRKKLGIADWQAVVGDGVTENQRNIGIKGRMQK